MIVMADGITDEMIETAAATITQEWSDELSTREMARIVLESALAGRAVVELPEPDDRTVQAFVQYWNGDPATLPQEERFVLQRLADIRAARRLVTEQSSADVAAGGVL